MPRRVLVVEPDRATHGVLRRAIGLMAQMDGCADFWAARARVLSNEYAFLVTNLRLEAYNGLHLVYLGLTSGALTRSIVYTATRDVHLAREVQASGAFYEPRDRLPHALRGYLQADLPGRDRRNAAVPDRRDLYRGGRRCSDLPVVAAP